jgi:hypothetical protein
MVHAARAGDRATLARELSAASLHGTFALNDAARVAHAVVAREIGSAATPADAVARIHDVHACPAAVDDILADRMDTEDAVGGQAAFARVEARRLDGGGHGASTDDGWRAVAMWGATGGSEHDARLRGLVDGSPLVRRAALHAIADRDDGTDWGAVFDTARLDPEPLLRAAAVRALVRMRGAPADIAVKLRDLWTDADDGLRQVLAGAFASPAVRDAGGVDALAHLLRTSSGNKAVTVAGAIVGGRIEDARLRAAAVTILAAAIREGGHRARIHAIAVAPLPEGGRDEARVVGDAMQAAAHAEDLDVRVAALGRLAATEWKLSPADREHAVQELERLAAPDDDGSLTPRRSRARFLLAKAGDLRVQAWVEQDLLSKDPVVRLGAADALAALGRAARAAPLLADDDPSVRTRAACTVMVAARWP